MCTEDISNYIIERILLEGQMLRTGDVEKLAATKVRIALFVNGFTKL